METKFHDFVDLSNFPRKIWENLIKKIRVSIRSTSSTLKGNRTKWAGERVASQRRWIVYEWTRTRRLPAFRKVVHRRFHLSTKASTTHKNRGWPTLGNVVFRFKRKRFSLELNSFRIGLYCIAYSGRLARSATNFICNVKCRKNDTKIIFQYFVCDNVKLWIK